MHPKRKPLFPFYIGGVVVVRVPENTPVRQKGHAIASMKQLAYDWSERVVYKTDWKKRRKS